MVSNRNALAVIPQSTEIIQAGWWERTALPAITRIDELDVAQEMARRVAALGKYVKDRKQRFELDAARIVAEIRIGELLGNGIRGKPKINSTHEWNIVRGDRDKFRLLASHRSLVLRLLHERVASRRRILARIQRSKQIPSTITGIELRMGDFQTALDDLAGIVDAIVTDPPYAREFLPLYGQLSRVADRLLRPGGICAVMVGKAYLPDVMVALGHSLTYRWMLAYLTGGAAPVVYDRRVQTYWKPILIYEKSPPNPDHRIGSDVIRAEGGDTDPTYHHWGQNESGMLALILRLTTITDLIVDPFAGGGTTLLAAARCGRRAIGCELDQAVARTARQRLGL